jgi:hypothetical protein
MECEEQPLIKLAPFKLPKDLSLSPPPPRSHLQAGTSSQKEEINTADFIQHLKFFRYHSNTRNRSCVWMQEVRAGEIEGDPRLPAGVRVLPLEKDSLGTCVLECPGISWWFLEDIGYRFLELRREI